MTVSKRFKFRFAGHIFRRTVARGRRETGSALFEFAVVLPTLALFLIGIFYGGITFYDDLVLANAVAVGARVLQSGQGDVNVCTDAYNAVTSAAFTLSAGLIYIEEPPTFTQVSTTTGTSAGASSCDVTSGKNLAGTSCAPPNAPCQEIITGEYATLTATYPCSMYFPSLGINLCPTLGKAGNPANPNCPYSAYCVSATTTVRIE